MTLSLKYHTLMVSGDWKSNSYQWTKANSIALINVKGFIIVWQANVNKFPFIEIVNWNFLECLLYSIVIITWARSEDDKNFDLFTVDKQFKFLARVRFWGWGFGTQHDRMHLRGVLYYGEQAKFALLFFYQRMFSLFLFSFKIKRVRHLKTLSSTSKFIKFHEEAQWIVAWSVVWSQG